MQESCIANVNLQVSKWFAMYPVPYICLATWHQLFLKFWLVNTWFFAYPLDQRAVTRLENVRQLNIRRGKKLGFVIECLVENVLEKRIDCPILQNNLKICLLLEVSRLLQVVSDRCRSFQVVLCFSKYLKKSSYTLLIKYTF